MFWPPIIRSSSYLFSIINYGIYIYREALVRLPGPDQGSSGLKLAQLMSLSADIARQPARCVVHRNLFPFQGIRGDVWSVENK